MATRWQLTAVAIGTLLVTSSAHADIYRWGTGELIPGTEGKIPGPGMALRGWSTPEFNLRYADLSGDLDLRDCSLQRSWLDYARLADADLTNADLMLVTLTSALLTNANLSYATLLRGTLTDAN